METNHQYALYDGDTSCSRQWVAHVRLTPELLQRLQQQPDSVTIQLQAPGAGNAVGVASRSTRASSAKLNSVLTIDDGGGDEPEKYEMLSFVEDPTVNAVCAFRADPLGGRAATDDMESKDTNTPDPGYSLFEVGRVYQKLIVQRMLDSTEKDRMKDRHAKSVLESKARSSKLVDATLSKPSTGRATRGKAIHLRGVALAHPPGQDPATRLTKRATVEETSSSKKRKLRSALTSEAVFELKERIAQRPKALVLDESGTEAEAKEESQAPMQSKSVIFSSDSDTDRTEQPPTIAEAKPTTAANATSPKKAARKATAKRELKPKAMNKKDASVAIASQDAAAQAKQPHSEPAPGIVADPTGPEAIGEELVEATAAAALSSEPSLSGEKQQTSGEDGHTLETKRKLVLLPVKADKTETKKRARPRLSRRPDITFLPQNVQDICKRVSSHITRTTILDASDHESFAADHDRLRAEWEELDKAFSIETILLDGAHFQLPFASTDEEKKTLRETIESGEKKREGLAFVRDSMTAIHKILGSLQASIAAYEQKTTPS